MTKILKIDSKKNIKESEKQKKLKHENIQVGDVVLEDKRRRIYWNIF